MNDSYKPTLRGARAGGSCRSLLAAGVAAALLPLATLATEPVDYTPDYTKLMEHSDHHGVHDSALVKKIFDATKRYQNIREALVVDNSNKYLKPQPQWVVGTPCVSGPETGAMGIHIVNPNRLGNGKVDFAAPAALIYEPQPNGDMVLVGLEYIQDATAWHTANGKASVPSLDGHLMNFVDAPNRYGLDPFYEIHVWAFQENPKGAFADWNTHVTCEKQPFNFTVKP
jgi:hypothetical protein